MIQEFTRSDVKKLKVININWHQIVETSLINSIINLITMVGKEFHCNFLEKGKQQIQSLEGCASLTHP